MFGGLTEAGEAFGAGPSLEVEAAVLEKPWTCPPAVGVDQSTRDNRPWKEVLFRSEYREALGTEAPDARSGLCRGRLPQYGCPVTVVRFIPAGLERECGHNVPLSSGSLPVASQFVVEPGLVLGVD